MVKFRHVSRNNEHLVNILVADGLDAFQHVRGIAVIDPGIQYLRLVVLRQ